MNFLLYRTIIKNYFVIIKFNFHKYFTNNPLKLILFQEKINWSKSIIDLVKVLRMIKSKFNSYRIYYNFLSKLAKDLTSFYYKKLDRPFKVINKAKKKGYDPVTSADKAFEKFIRLRINSANQKNNV